MDKNKKDYFLGLDIGTESVGYAVTDENYKVLKFNGKSMWGSRLFDEAKTAEERRIFRCNTRRLQRRKWRVNLLQELFAEEISKVDISFFRRLKESALFIEDKSIEGKYTLFNDKNYKDFDFHQNFKSIYHLRQALLKGEKEYDVRLVYLAIHHILKNRGHFLFSDSIENVTSFETTFDTFKYCLKDELGIEIECNDKKSLEEVLKDKNLNITNKKSKLIKLFNCDKKNKQLTSIISLISGSKVSLSDIFADESLKDIDTPRLSFSQDSYEETRSVLEDILQDRGNTLDVIKSVYNWAILANILKAEENEGKAYLSNAKVKVYDEHSKDLKKLKYIVKKYDKDLYIEFFKKNVKNNYCSYIGFYEKNKKKKTIKKCSKEDFYKNVTKILTRIKTLNTETNVLKEIEDIESRILSKEFMPLQVTKSNGVIPYQVNYMELENILGNSSKYLTFLDAKDRDGLTLKDKILILFKFRIPYYVGPLNTSVSKNSWMIRKRAGIIKPWNFKEMVDVDASANSFIRRMTNKCTYLVGKDVLPKCSLLYCEFEVLNEINNIKLKGEYLPLEIKLELFERVFKNKKRVTIKNIQDFLRAEGYSFEKNELTGIDKDIKSSLRSYIDMQEIFSREIKTLSDKFMVEDIILYITLYKDDKKMLKRVIRKKYDENKIDDISLKRLSRLKYDGWGRLSREFLTEIEGVDTETGEYFSIIQALRKTNGNLMKLLSNKYTFLNEIENWNRKLGNEINEISYQTLIKDLYVSPKIKRSIWQVVQITEEIKKIMGKEPKKIFIEVAREHQESKRTKSRKDKLIELYEKCKSEERDWKQELEKIKESDFRSIKLYLYYTQMGRCMYTGSQINLSELADTTIYDRDHIYPKSLTKDDSLDNLVLVKKDINAIKSNDVLSIDIQNKMKGFWMELRRKEFISEEKFNRLTRTKPLTEEELSRFISRQLVETRQSTKIVANLFKDVYTDAEVVYVKAKAVSDFRNENLKLVKVRSLNDLHHAKDAYLNIVVGNVYHEKFTSNPLKWIIRNGSKNKYNLNRMFDFDLIKNGREIWKRGRKGTIEKVRKQIKKNDIQCTRYSTTNKGQLFNLQIVKASEDAQVSIKKGMDVRKYGGYKSLTPAYFSLVESLDRKGNKIRSIESVPLYKVKEFEGNISKYQDYCREIYKLNEPIIIIPRIKKDSKLIIDNFPMNLRGSTGKQLIFQGAVQLILEEDEEKYLKKIEKYINRNVERKDKKENLKINDSDMISREKNINLYEVLLLKQKETIYKYRPGSQVIKIEEGKDKFKKLSIEEQCIVLNEILNLLRCKPVTANLLLIDGAKDAGKIQKNKLISNSDSVKMINESVTGLFKNEINLKKI